MRAVDWTGGYVRPHKQRATYLQVLVVRYDSALRFPNLTGFPEHKHQPDATIPALRPRIADVLAQAASQ